MNRSKSSRLIQGFTLVEILIVVIILGILAALVIPSMAASTDEAQQQVFIDSLKSYAQATWVYMNQTGEYLEDSSSGDCPAGWETYVHEGRWTAGTPIGGVWDFELDSHGIKSAFGVHFDNAASRKDDTFMLQIDSKFDNGDLSTGIFRKIAADRYYYILEDL